MLVLNDLEIGRGRDEADVDEVLSLSDLTRSIGKGATMAHVIEKVLRSNGATACTVPGNFPLELADQIRARRIKVETKNAGAFYPQRLLKTPAEIRGTPHFVQPPKSCESAIVRPAPARIPIAAQ